ncbi:hypothetical protein BKA65DRAFT_482923 [Rhexocercosporidium sp. MPI-PUGE-AT-0058]|nr:hypothetical protein BKA65DRAFT_482923 [Rhexocercosporidium sp. MPI-PUGE-AT-0058]
MATQYTPNKAIPTSPLYASCIINIKQKARTWGISSQNFDLDYTRISSQIRVHGAYGAYSEVEKLWHIEFYMWGKYFGVEPFPFPFPSTTTATLISATNPAPAPMGSQAMNSTPVLNPYPPMYTPGEPHTPVTNAHNTCRFSPAPGSGSRAHLSQYLNQHHQGSSPESGLRNGFMIRGLAGNTGSPRYSNMGQAYNNRPTRGRGTYESRGAVGSEGYDGGERSGQPLDYKRSGGGQGGERVENGGGGGGQRNGRGAVYAARRQLKIARRTGGRN